MPGRLAVAIFVLLALPGCGDEGVSTGDYARDLDEICAGLKAETDRIQQSRPADTTELTRQVDALREATTSGIERMRALERPGGEDGQKAERYVRELEATTTERLVPALEALEKALAAGDQPGVRAAARRLQQIEDEDAQARTDELARDLGANRCASG